MKCPYCQQEMLKGKVCCDGRMGMWFERDGAQDSLFGKKSRPAASDSRQRQTVAVCCAGV